MTFRQKLKENKDLIQRYSNYLMSGEKMKEGDHLKLVNEIARLDAQKRAIEQMPYVEIDNDINDYTIEVT